MSCDREQIKAMHLHLLPERYFAVIVIGSMAKLQKAARAQVSRRRAFSIGGAGGRARGRGGPLSPGEAARASTPVALLR